MVMETRRRVHRRDRWVSWIVVGVFIVALVLGWVVKTAAEGRSTTCEVDGAHTSYPSGWVLADVELPVLLHAQDLWATPFRTTITLERRPVPQDVAKPLSTIQNMIALERGQSWTAYRTLTLEDPVSVNGYAGMRTSFAYVEADPNPFFETVPVVMHGQDYVLPVGDQVYIATVTAAEANYAQAKKALLAMVRSLQVP